MNIIAIFLAASTVLAAPTSGTNEIRAASDPESTTFKDAFGKASVGPYMFYHNNFGASTGRGGQSSTFNSIKGRTASWSTSWNWSGGASSVKAYPNIALEGIKKQLSQVSKIPTTWSWSYTGTNIDADVSYDLWLSPTSGGSDAYEIMVWLASYGGAAPTGSHVDTVDLAGSSWDVHSGGGGTKVISFVAAKPITNFSADLNEFFKYLVRSQGVPSTMFIDKLQGGTESFSGADCKFTTSAYSISVS